MSNSYEPELKVFRFVKSYGCDVRQTMQRSDSIVERIEDGENVVEPTAFCRSVRFTLSSKLRRLMAEVVINFRSVEIQAAKRLT